MRVMGIDPGTRIVGYGFVDQRGSRLTAPVFGAIRADVNAPHPWRLRDIHTALRELIEKHRPDAVAVEEVFVGKSPQAAMRVGEGRAVAMLAATLSDVAVFEYATRSAKQSVVGTGAATKDQVAKMVTRLLGLREVPKPQDVTDALALALCHLRRRKVPGAVRGR